MSFHYCIKAVFLIIIVPHDVTSVNSFTFSSRINCTFGNTIIIYTTHLEFSHPLWYTSYRLPLTAGERAAYNIIGRKNTMY